MEASGLRNSSGVGMKGREYIVLLDTNVLIHAVSERLKVFDAIQQLLDVPYRLCITKSILGELEKLANEGRPSTKRFARLALELARRMCEVIDDSDVPGDRVDEKIVNFAKSRGNVVVVTNDMSLKRKLDSLGIPTIYLRSGKRFELSYELY